ncbi:MAG: hypothetical protein HY270_13945 [Deltaproteobacteria bacterium]|nr:hypothetical protein [Deltaproteobacteria bacterium]
MRSGLVRVVVVSVGLACGLVASRAAAIPVFARIYDKPCGACHSTFPQLNPEGENFRTHGFHGLQPAIKPINAGSAVDLPGTLPIALYFTTGEDLSREVAAGHSPIRTHFNLNSLSVLAGGEIGQHLSFLVDYRPIEMEADSGKTETYTVPYQAYVVGHVEGGGWLGNIRAGWYELPLGVSPAIHRLSARPYLIYGLNSCGLLSKDPPHGECEYVSALSESQIGLELNAVHPKTGLNIATGFTNGSNNRLDNTASKDFYAHVSRAFGSEHVGLFVFYSPDIIGAGTNDRALRIGPDIDFYSRRFRLLGQFLAGYDSNPTGYHQSLLYYGGFVEGDFRLTTALLTLLRCDMAWMPQFDDRQAGGDTRQRRRLWEITGGMQLSLLQDLKLVAELTYGENHEGVSNETEKTWAGTLRLVTAFWPFAPPLPTKESILRLGS